MLDYAFARRRMIERQISARGIADPAVAAAMGRVPREQFVDPGLSEFAYEDTPLPIAEGQTISQPYIVGRMLEAAAVHPGDRVLEVGTGSGYLAALLAEMGAEVFTIERRTVLAEAARERLAALGYERISVHSGDGTTGLPDAAPFDAIIASAGGPGVPESLTRQLKPGGRLVIPVGETAREQRLRRLVLRPDGSLDEQELDAVRFVPLIGREGWDESERRPSPAARPAKPREPHEIVAEAAEVLPDLDDPTFGAAFDRFGDRRVVLLGEASHGTSEFYRARAAITRRLVDEHGFRLVAVEADWPDAAAIDRHVRGKPPLPGAEPPFRRFPTWMWRNTDFDAFIGWMREHNAGRPVTDQARFFGLDLYNLSASIAAVVGYLEQVDPEAARVARERYGCLTPWQKDPTVYGRAVLHRRHAECEPGVVAQLKDLLASRGQYAGEDGELFLDATQNARLVAAAERYYRTMYYGAAESWNLRDTHMFETLTHILEAHGPGSKAVVWAHNSHIGNAAHTEMGSVREEINIGQLCRERFGEDAALIGFGTHTGTVAAATDWDDPVEVKDVRPSHARSYENLCHKTGLPPFLLDFGAERSAVARELLMPSRLERFIGVIYRPETELMSHYTDACLPQQFDAYVFFDETEAVTPLPTRQQPGMDDTYPFGL